jgi:hypothetical protein
VTLGVGTKGLDGDVCADTAPSMDRQTTRKRRQRIGLLKEVRMKVVEESFRVTLQESRHEQEKRGVVMRRPGYSDVDDMIKTVHAIHLY